jgi:hypothetical protein
MSDLKALEVYQSRDYDKFVIDSEYNREVDLKHVKKLEQCFKDAGDFGKLYPIIVDDKFRIIDGQHRFTARKKLGLIIYYIQTLEITSEKLGMINDGIAKWKPNDFLKVAKKSRIVKFMIDYKKDLSSAYSLGILLRCFMIKKKDLINDKEETLLRLQKTVLHIKPYLKWFETGITNPLSNSGGKIPKDSASQLPSSFLIALSKKLAKQAVRIEDIPVGFSYVELLSWFAKNGYKI